MKKTVSITLILASYVFASGCAKTTVTISNRKAVDMTDVVLSIVKTGDASETVTVSPTSPGASVGTLKAGSAGAVYNGARGANAYVVTWKSSDSVLGLASGTLTPNKENHLSFKTNSDVASVSTSASVADQPVGN